MTPWSDNWAFNRYRGQEIKRHWDMIPDCDILITHGPPMGILDVTATGEHVGCQDLLDTIKRIKPSLSLFGHIHENGSKTYYDGDTLYSNGCLLDKRYNFVNKPIGIDLEWNNKKLVASVK